MRALALTIRREQSGKTVKDVLRRELNLSSHQLARLKRRPDGILLNGAPVFVTHPVEAGDVLQIEIGDPPARAIAPLDIPLHVVYEDEDLLILDKSAGMAVHASSLTPDTPTVAGALAGRWEEGFIFHPVNRLDKGTTGLMAVARSGYVHDRLRLQLHSGEFSREYLAVARGHPEPPCGRIDLPIGRDESSAIRRCIRPDGDRAVTVYETLRRTERHSLIRLLPETGRTHQLRLHLASVGHPLEGDWLYGEGDSPLIGRPALHSHVLHLRHPITGEALRFTSPLPPDMESLLLI
ncbi:RluA family pseudouridine synthase [Oscillibacter sp. MSJ-2]|uniref:Pseudouridine synthase n=1 Tax=Dysosmobacter acutus TaxID=2841504 RepID=A0ABS6FB65_9FIRM|nr:RluA family pseudouridine synthase [Dysosmobacter acutus]MBU5627528.1 RluA family pseudouridine synthase [Dysosmobacter acutus]